MVLLGCTLSIFSQNLYLQQNVSFTGKEITIEYTQTNISNNTNNFGTGLNENTIQIEKTIILTQNHRGIVHQSGEYSIISSDSMIQNSLDFIITIIDLMNFDIVGSITIHNYQRSINSKQDLIESVNEDWIYFLGYDLLNIIDISNKESPYLVKSYINDKLINSVKLVESWDGQYVYILCPLNNKLLILDVSNIDNIFITNEHESYLFENSSSMEISKGKEIIFIACYLYNTIVAIDVSNPFDIIMLSQISDSSKLMYPSSLAISHDEKYLYVSGNSYIDHSMTILDISNSNNINIINSLNLPYQSCSCCEHLPSCDDGNGCPCELDDFRLDISSDDNFIAMISTKTDSIFRIEVSDKYRSYVSDAIIDDNVNMSDPIQVKILPNNEQSMVICQNSITIVNF